ncbi:MAG: type II toxin-antitoxin system RelE/ParE family toxin [Planctomycetota bacterium]
MAHRKRSRHTDSAGARQTEERDEEARAPRLITHSVHPTAERELRRAARWYHREATIGKRDEFLDRFEGTVARACSSASAGTISLETRGLTVRAMRLHGFPYRIFYFVRGDHLRVIAVVHVRRRPGYWHWRLRGESQGA